MHLLIRVTVARAPRRLFSSSIELDRIAAVSLRILAVTLLWLLSMRYRRTRCHPSRSPLDDSPQYFWRNASMAFIQPLPESTISQLRSSCTIQSLPSCLVELVQNALDAKARNIEIAYGLESWQCRVTDDGIGIGQNSLTNVARRYCKSRYIWPERRMTKGPLRRYVQVWQLARPWRHTKLWVQRRR